MMNMNNNPSIPSKMKAAVIRRFGGPEQLKLEEIGVPGIGPDDVLIRLAYAGVGEWDAAEREGVYARMMNMDVKFPYVPGSEGSGTVAVKGEKVRHVEVGDEVWAPGFLNPQGGFYAEYVAVNAASVSRIPAGGVSLPEAAVLLGIGVTALRGLDDKLRLSPGESVLVFGAGGGVGHAAVQLAQSMGARVFAVASGVDGVELVRQLGCDDVVNGKDADFAAKARAFAPDGFDAALFTAGGESADAAALCVREGGRFAFPHGIRPEPRIPAGVTSTGYHGEPDPEIIGRLRGHIDRKGIKAHIDGTFALENARQAHEELRRHYLGKLVLRVNP